MTGKYELSCIAVRKGVIYVLTCAESTQEFLYSPMKYHYWIPDVLHSCINSMQTTTVSVICLHRTFGRWKACWIDSLCWEIIGMQPMLKMSSSCKSQKDGSLNLVWSLTQTDCCLLKAYSYQQDYLNGNAWRSREQFTWVPGTSCTDMRLRGLHG